MNNTEREQATPKKEMHRKAYLAVTSVIFFVLFVRFFQAGMKIVLSICFVHYQVIPQPEGLKSGAEDCTL